MPVSLSPFDVQNLNRSLEGIGNAVAENRKEEGQTRKEDIEADFRKQMLQSELRRTQAEESRASALGQRNELEDKKQLLNTIMGLNATGQLKDVDAVNKYLSADPHWSKTGLQLKTPPDKPPSQAGQNTVAKAIQDTEMWRTKGEAAKANGDDDLASQYSDYADKLDKWTKKEVEPTPATETVTEETPASAAIPGTPATSGGLFGSPKPAIPPVPAMPKRTIKRTVPVGVSAPISAPSGDSELQAAKAAIASGKDPSAVKTRYQQRTGNPYPE